MNLGGEQGFVSVDIADAGDDVLIQQGGLDRSACAAEALSQCMGTNGNRLRTQSGPGARFEFGEGGKGGKTPKAARVAENESATRGPA